MGLGLSNAEEIVFLAATVPLLLSVKHNRDVFSQVAFTHIPESTKRAEFRVGPVDSTRKVARSKVAAVAG